MKYASFTEMPVWNSAMKLSVSIFEVTVLLPKSEDYGLTSQLRRAANSVSANIAEGFGRKTSKDKSAFYMYAKSSAFEVQSHLLYGQHVKYFDHIKVAELVGHYNQLIHGINKVIKTLQQPNY